MRLLNSRTSLSPRLPVLVGVSLLLSATFASAQTTQPSTSPTDPFPAGTWTLNLTSQYVNGCPGGRHDQFFGGAFGASYYLFDRFAIIGDLPFYYIDQREGADAVAGGFELLARWHFATIDKLTLYIDGGAGMLLADNRVPVDGTNFNFTPQFGLGATYQLSDDLFLESGARIYHLSNAGIDPGVNPSINYALEGYVGLLFKL